MKIELTTIALSACLAMSNGITLGLEAESRNDLEGAINDLIDDAVEDATGNFDAVTDVTAAAEAIDDAANGVIDGACYREIYLPRIEPPQWGDCGSGWKVNDFPWLCQKECGSKWREEDFGCRHKKKWWKWRVHQLKGRPQTACPAGYTDDVNDLALCYEEPAPGFVLQEEGLASSICPDTVPHECGPGLCTTDAAECTQRLNDMSTSATDFFLDLSAQNYLGAVSSGANTAEAFAIAKCA